MSKPAATKTCVQVYTLLICSKLSFRIAAAFSAVKIYKTLLCDRGDVGIVYFLTIHYLILLFYLCPSLLSLFKLRNSYWRFWNKKTKLENLQFQAFMESLAPTSTLQFRMATIINFIASLTSFLYNLSAS